jgi:hypothetical protein
VQSQRGDLGRAATGHGDRDGPGERDLGGGLSVAAALREDTARLREFVAGGIRAAQDAGEVPAGLDPALAATTLLALVEGLGLHVLGEHYGAETALAVFDAHLGTVFGQSSRSARDSSSRR